MKINVSNNGKFESVNINIPDCPLVFVEGYEFTGKSYFMSAFTSSYKVYEPGYHEDLTNRVIPYNHRYALGITLVDMVNRGLITYDRYMINRGLLSALVYNELYHQKNSVFYSPEFLRYMHDNYSDPRKVHVIYICHDNIENAKFLYSMSKNRSNESYDEFADFDDYWKSYLKFNELYSDYLPKVCDKNYTILSSVDYKVLRGWSESK